MILCGAKAVQVGTCHWIEGSSCFDRIAMELEALMISKGYKSIEEFRGKLKPYSNDNVKPAAKPPRQKLDHDQPQIFYLCCNVLIAVLAVSVCYCINKGYAPFSF